MNGKRLAAAPVSGDAAAAPGGFASDNHAGAHPEVLAAIAAANAGHAAAYGADPLDRARRGALVRGHFGADARAFFVFNGTGANVAAIDALTGALRGGDLHRRRPHARRRVRRARAPRRGQAADRRRTAHGKLDGRRRSGAGRRGAATSTSRSRGSSRSPSRPSSAPSTRSRRPRAIADAAHERGMYLHVDGARLANAAASLELPLAALTTEAGVDVVSFGGTKNGLRVRRRGRLLPPRARRELCASPASSCCQLASKMRFVVGPVRGPARRTSCGWRSARHANAMASAARGRGRPDRRGRDLHPVEANAVFARLGRAAIDRLLAACPASTRSTSGTRTTGDRALDVRLGHHRGDVDAFAAAVAAATAG